MENIRNSCYDRFYEVVIPIVIYERNTLHDCFALLSGSACLASDLELYVFIGNRITYLQIEVKCFYYEENVLYCGAATKHSHIFIN